MEKASCVWPWEPRTKTNIIYKYTRNSIPLHFFVFPYINPAERSTLPLLMSPIFCGHFCHTFTRPKGTSLPIKLIACCQHCVWAKAFSTELASTVSPCSCCLCLGSWAKSIGSWGAIKSRCGKSVWYQCNIVDDSEIRPSPPGMYKNTVESK